MARTRDQLDEYAMRRDFTRTREPAGGGTEAAGGTPRFVIQKHAARRLHYDLRLELNGVLKSWAVPKGPSLDPEVRSLAVHVEDHPFEYRTFEGTIPRGEYGAGTVMLWDHGTWRPVGDPAADYQSGRLRFQLSGRRLRGEWLLARMTGEAAEGGRNWLLIKKRDAHARPATEASVTDAHVVSVVSGRTMSDIAAAGPQTGLPAPPADAPRTALPATLAPQLPSPVRRAPEGDAWLHELKFDGYRILARLEGARATLVTRGGHHWNSRFPTVVNALLDLAIDDTLIDGEIAVRTEDGRTDFQALQNQLDRGRAETVAYFVFDLPFLHGHDLRRIPLIERKGLLEELLASRNHGSVLRYSDHIVGDGPGVVRHACRLALEGIVSKRAGARYREGRSPEWVKIKCLARQEFVVGGWTEPSGGRSGFGALLLGWYDDQDLIFCGRVGTGFSAASLRDVRAELDALATDAPPFAKPPPDSGHRAVHWVSPTLVAEVEFSGWTADGRLRHPTFRGLRQDKPARTVTREAPVARPAPKGPRRRIAGVRLSHPQRVLYPEQGITKRDLAEYYAAVADWLLPHLIDRPLSLVRCPGGIDKECFYQKHLTEGIPEPVRGITVRNADKSRLFVAVDDLRGVITLVQFGVLEFHPWGSRGDRLDRPDRIVIDLDPGPGVTWARIVSAALLVRERLEDLGLATYLRTTGGKGLHVVVPIARRSSWDEVKGFARNLARSLERSDRSRFVSTASKARRAGRIYVDWLRNSRGATAIASYSTRARPGATVATPLSWAELPTLERPDRYTIENVPQRLNALARDPWEGFADARQVLTRRVQARAAP